MGAPEANKVIERKYKEGMKLEDAQKLALEVFKEILDKEFALEKLEAAAITAKGTEMLKMSE
jgi:20S proteasome alpha/beta subunit